MRRLSLPGRSGEFGKLAAVADADADAQTRRDGGATKDKDSTPHRSSPP